MAVLRQRPNGISSADMASTVGVSCRTAKRVLLSLRHLGMADSTRSANRVIYSTPDRCAYLRRLGRDRKRAKALCRKRREQRERQQEAEAREWIRIKQLIVPAGRMPPPVCTAPNSVFALASF